MRSMQVERKVEVDEKFRFFQKVAEELRELRYDYKRCTGCGICIYACPVGAIELSSVHDIASGLDMPPAIIDHLKCAFCGICYSLCPFNAYDFYINGKRIEKASLPISPTAFTEKLENCIECVLCYKACPTNAIKRDVRLRREDIEEKNVGIVGKLLIDRDKCNFCGICREFCKVFRLVEKEVRPDDVIPYEELLIDENKCDYCKLCEEICPEKAIKVEGKRIDFKIEKIAEISIDQELCSHCGYCEKVCPYDAVKTVKPMEGELILYKARVYKCLSGCDACVKICKHNRVWWISDAPHFNSEFCIYCGACENACPYGLIEVRRFKYYTKELLSNFPWREAWEKAVGRVVLRQKAKQPEIRFLKATFEMAEEELEMEEARCMDTDRLKAVEEALKRPGYRRAFESGKIDLFLEAVKKYARENKNKKA
jgi:4Fe-4S ferredoxin